MQPVNLPPLPTRILRFLIVGAATAGVYALTTIALKPFGLGIATAVGVVISALVSYIGNHAWTFEAEGAHRHYFPRFMIVIAAGIALNQLLIIVLVHRLQWSYMYVMAGFVVGMPILNFIFHSIYSFRRKPHA